MLENVMGKNLKAKISCNFRIRNLIMVLENVYDGNFLRNQLTTKTGSLLLQKSCIKDASFGPKYVSEDDGRI